MKKRLLFIFLIVISLAGVFFIFSKQKIPAKSEMNQKQEKENNFHFSDHMDKSFYGNLDGITSDGQMGEKIYGGIVSHHLLVAKEIAKFFQTFEEQSPKTFVVIGPDHFNVGSGDILTSRYSYKTPWGTVESQEKYVEKLINKKAVYVDEEPFFKEHSISALVSFIKYYYPDAKIVPIILKRSVDRERTDYLAKNLNEILSDDAVVVSSVDFSHHLSNTTAQFHDERSISAITNFDYDRILESEIDSPASIYVLQKYLELQGAQRMIYKNINSAIFSGNLLSNDVTSYLFAHFVEGKVQNNDKISLLSFGDLMLGRDVRKAMESGLDPFEKIKGPEGNFLRGVDFISANLEGPITENDDCVKKAYSFKFNPSMAETMLKYGVNVVNLANNHSGDCKEQGFLDTQKYLSESGVGFFGVPSLEKSYLEKKVNGQKIAFMGIDVTVHSDDLTGYYELIKKLKEENDFVVVNIHWGYEYHESPSQTQKEIAYSLVDSGADLIIGHHPHIIQPMEVYKNKAIFYSLGNFIFDQIGEKQNEGFGVGTVFGKEGIEFSLFPYDIKKFQPALRTPERAKVFCDQYLGNVQNHDGCRFKLE